MARAQTQTGQTSAVGTQKGKVRETEWPCRSYAVFSKGVGAYAKPLATAAAHKNSSKATGLAQVMQVCHSATGIDPLEATSAAGVAQGVGEEARAFWRSQMERMVLDMDLVRRDEFDAVKDLAAAARAEADSLKARLDALEAS
eukprot:gene11356-15191_t